MAEPKSGNRSSPLKFCSSLKQISLGLEFTSTRFLATQSLTCISNLYADLQDYKLNDRNNTVLHRDCTAITRMHRHCTVTALMHGHCTDIAQQCTVTTRHARTSHGTHAHHTAGTHITRQAHTSHGKHAHHTALD